MRNIFLRKQTTAAHVPRVLPVLIWVLALTGIILWLYLLYYLLFIFKMPKDDPFIGLARTSNIVRRVTFLTISASGLYILIKAAYTRATLYFALLFTYASAGEAYHWLIYNGTLPQNWSVVSGVMDTLLGIILIRTFREFPGRLSLENIKNVYRHYPLKFFVPLFGWLLPAHRTWLVFLPLGLVFGYLIPAGLAWRVIVICFSLVYLFAQLRIHKTAFKKPLYWLLWVVSLNLFWGLLLLSAQLFNLQIPNPANLFSDIALNVSLLFAFVMSVFFSDLLDAKLILQKTVVFGAVIFLFTFVFGVAEHFVIHKLSHYFNLEDVYVTSTFACIMGMFFHPLKQRLTHWMKHFDHSREHEHVNELHSYQAQSQ